jgi:hypothetical protein
MPHTPQRTPSWPSSQQQHRRAHESPGSRGSSRKLVQNNKHSRSSSRSRSSVLSVPPPQGAPPRRRSSSRSRRSTPTHHGQSHGYFPQSTNDYDVTSVSSAPSLTKNEDRQHVPGNIRKDNSLRDDSPAKRSVTTHSSNKGTRLTSERISSIRTAIEGV